MIISGVPKKYVLDCKKIVDLMERKKRDGNVLSEFEECALRLVHDRELPSALDTTAFIHYLYDSGFSIDNGSFGVDGTRIQYSILFLSMSHYQLMWDNFCKWKSGIRGRWNAICDGILAQLESFWPLKQKSQ